MIVRILPMKKKSTRNERLVSKSVLSMVVNTFQDQCLRRYTSATTFFRIKAIMKVKLQVLKKLHLPQKRPSIMNQLKC